MIYLAINNSGLAYAQLEYFKTAKLHFEFNSSYLNCRAWGLIMPSKRITHLKKAIGEFKQYSSRNDFWYFA